MVVVQRVVQVLLWLMLLVQKEEEEGVKDLVVAGVVVLAEIQAALDVTDPKQASTRVVVDRGKTVVVNVLLQTAEAVDKRIEGLEPKRQQKETTWLCPWCCWQQK